MDHSFPIKTKQAQSADYGLDVVSATVHKMGWEFRRTPQEADFGIDGYIDIVTPERYVTGKSIAVQIKCGPSYFRTKTSNGWTYRGQLKHVNYYLNSPTGILLIIVNEAGEAWWRLFEVYETSKSPAGWTIEIPSAQAFSPEAKSSLEMVAGGHVDYLAHLEEFWSIEEDIIKNDYFIVQIQRIEIETLNVRPFARIFERFSATAELRMAAKNKIDFVIAGYDQDPRELPEIPEVVAWLRLATLTVKYFIFYLAMMPFSQGFKQVLAAHCEMTRLEGGMYVSDLDGLPDLTNFLFGHLNEFTELHDLEEFNRPLSEEFMGFVARFIGVDEGLAKIK